MYFFYLFFCGRELKARIRRQRLPLLPRAQSSSLERSPRLQFFTAQTRSASVSASRNEPYCAVLILRVCASPHRRQAWDSVEARSGVISFYFFPPLKKRKSKPANATRTLLSVWGIYFSSLSSCMGGGVFGILSFTHPPTGFYWEFSSCNLDVEPLLPSV